MRITIGSIPEIKNPPKFDFSVALNRDEAQKLINGNTNIINTLQSQLKDALTREYNMSFRAPDVIT